MNQVPQQPQQYPQGQAPVQKTGYYADLEQNKERELQKIKEKLLAMRKRQVIGSSIYLPEEFKFATQNPSEEILILTRTHWIVNLGWVIRHIFFVALPFIVSFIYGYFKLQFDFVNVETVSLFLILYYSFILTSVITNFCNWYFDPYIVTNERIVHYEYKPFSAYDIKETMLQSLDIITEDSLGILGNIFNYGDVKMVTEAQHLEFLFKKIPNQTEVRNLIADLTTIAKRYDR